MLCKSFLAAGAAIAGARAQAESRQATADGDPNILVLPEHSRTLGKPVAANPYGLPSRFETSLLRRESPGLPRVSAASVAFTPLQGLFGIITPSGLHFERHHQGWHDIDPSRHRLMINGLVKNPKIYTMDDLMRMPSVSRMHFIECGANTAMEWGNVAVPSVQYSHGMLSCSEFTGVPLSVLLEDCGFDKRDARVVLAEGADGSSMTRTVSIERALDDVLVAWGMNGEMLRPENGYPLRLVVPGVQGVSWVKWLRRIVKTTDFGDPVFDPYVIKEMNGVAVAVIGQALPYTPNANPSYLIPEWTFGIQEENMQKMVDEARGKGAKVVVVLSHNGMDVDLKMASRVRGIDAILGGHTHDGVPVPVIVSNGGGKTLVTNAGSNGKFLGVLDLDVRDGHVRGFQYRLLPVHGERTSASALAQHYGVRVAPTVVLLDGAGNLLAPPLVGGDVSGMYGAYLDSALAEAAAKLAAGRPRPPHKTTRQLRLREIS